MENWSPVAPMSATMPLEQIYRFGENERLN